MTLIFWADINGASEPGNYLFRDGHAEVAEKHVDLWKEEPAGFFKASRFVEVGTTNVRYQLSSFDAPRW